MDLRANDAQATGHTSAAFAHAAFSLNIIKMKPGAVHTGDNALCTVNHTIFALIG